MEFVSMKMMTDWQSERGGERERQRDGMNKRIERLRVANITAKNVEEKLRKNRKKPSEINNENIRIADVSCMQQYIRTQAYKYIPG